MEVPSGPLMQAKLYLNNSAKLVKTNSAFIKFLSYEVDSTFLNGLGNWLERKSSKKSEKQFVSV